MRQLLTKAYCWLTMLHNPITASEKANQQTQRLRLERGWTSLQSRPIRSARPRLQRHCEPWWRLELIVLYTRSLLLKIRRRPCGNPHCFKASVVEIRKGKLSPRSGSAESAHVRSKNSGFMLRRYNCSLMDIDSPAIDNSKQNYIKNDFATRFSTCFDDKIKLFPYIWCFYIQ